MKKMNIQCHITKNTLIFDDSLHNESWSNLLPSSGGVHHNWFNKSYNMLNKSCNVGLGLNLTRPSFIPSCREPGVNTFIGISFLPLKSSSN